MSKNYAYDAIVIGSGPNGLAAAIRLAQAGLSVVIFEAKETIGGGMRSAELTLPGFIHDICSAIHPLGIGSPFFQTLPLDQWGLEWIQPSAPLAHPFDDGTFAMLERSISATSDTLGEDARAYEKLMKPQLSNWQKISSDVLGTLRCIPRHPFAMARFGIQALKPAHWLATTQFKGKQARSFFAGLAAHSMLPLNWFLTGGFGLVLSILGHTYGWPMPRGGSQKIADALAAYFRSLGGIIVTNFNVQNLDHLPSARAILLDVTPRQLLKIAKGRFPEKYRRQLENYRYGPGVFKIDWALSSPIPWKIKECARAGTVHLGGSMEEIERSEREIWQNKHSEKPFVLLAQQSLFDPTRAPSGKHTGWGYCHVPHGSSVDMTERIEMQIERFAPGFRDCILARSIKYPLDLERYNANNIGGDINGGVQDISQFFSRPTARWVPYSTPVQGIYICSSSTPPGGGVHGMCGYHAANAVLKTL